MATAAILIDWRPAYLKSDHALTSLLLSPLGADTLLQRLRAQIEDADVHQIAVVPSFAHDELYERAIRTIVPTATVTSAAGFGGILDAYEPPDWLLIVDARYFPAVQPELRAALHEGPGCRLARHRVQLRRSHGGIRERVVCDREHRVRAIQRLYDGLTQLEVASVGSSLIPVSAARHLTRPDLFCLVNARTRLAARGVPSSDLTTAELTFALEREEDFLALSEQFTFADTDGDPRPPFTELAPNIWVGPGCRIHPTSRLYGPLILHENVVIDAQGVVIGPAVVGAGAHVGTGASVCQSVLAAGVQLAPGTSAAHAVRVPGPTGALGRQASLRWDRPPQRLAADPHTEIACTRVRPRLAAREDRLAQAVKRTFDIVAALLGLLVLAPLLALVAVLVKLTSRGPVLFGHEREGRNGQVFRCYKYRTMVDRAHVQQRSLYRHNSVDGPQFKLDNDPRITRLGQWLRTTNIDELPQLYNVLRGEMSLIGPRPSPFRENQICIPWREARLSVRPGITGLWQICRHERSVGDFHQWIYFDTLYVRHWSLGLDLRLMLATFLTLGGRWSIPISWLIPKHKLHRATSASEVPQRNRAAPAARARISATAPAPAAASMN